MSFKVKSHESPAPMSTFGRLLGSSCPSRNPLACFWYCFLLSANTLVIRVRFHKISKNGNEELRLFRKHVVMFYKIALLIKPLFYCYMVSTLLSPCRCRSAVAVQLLTLFNMEKFRINSGVNVWKLLSWIKRKIRFRNGNLLKKIV